SPRRPRTVVGARAAGGAGAGGERAVSSELKANLLVLLATLLFIGVMFCGVELGVRMLMPNVTSQDVDHRLFREHAFGATHGWEPNRTGTCFGRTVHIDSDGFLDVPHPAKAPVSWLLLGDSVCFGLGVDPDSIFATRLQQQLPEVR